MPYVLPYPALAISDADYASKMQANLDYVRDLLLLQQMTGSDLSASAAIATGQVAQYAISGAGISTGSAGIAAANIITGAVTEPKLGAASVVDGDINYASAKFLRTGGAGIWFARGTYTGAVTVSAGGVAVIFTADIPADTYESVGMTLPHAGWVTLKGTAAPTVPWTLFATVGSTSPMFTAYMASPEAITAFSGTYEWMAVGT